MARRSRLVLVVAGLVGLQALGLLGLAAFFVVEIVVATTEDVTRAVVALLLIVVAAVGLGLVARGLARGRRWARAPALVTQLLVIPVAIGLLQGGRWYVGGPLLLWALAVLVLLFMAAETEASED